MAVLGAVNDPPYCLFGRNIPQSVINANNEKWLDRMMQAQNTFIVVNGLIFAATFSAVNSFDAINVACTDPNCNSGLTFRALSAAAFCCSALAIVVSLIMITALTIYDPGRAAAVRVEILQTLNVLSQIGGVMTTSAIILTLCAVFPAPLSVQSAWVPGTGTSMSMPPSVTDTVTIGVWAAASLALLSTILIHFIGLRRLLGADL